ncbi:MAG: T9SS type A sorting domain-containing protein [Ignavibacteria bacterium]
MIAKDNKDSLQSFSRKNCGAKTLFIENNGQIGDQNGKPNPAVKYLILRPGLNIQLKDNSFSYDAYTIERFKRVNQLEEPLYHKFDKQNDDSMVYHFSRVDIELVDANPNPEITHGGASSDYLNFYTHITSQTKGEDGAKKIRGYSTITYHDIYPNIDLEWFLDIDGKPEYQFIINPGGDPSRIRLKYHGAMKTELISDALHIHIKPGIIKEHIPLSYLKESKEKLQIAFTKISNDEYGFNIPTYASNETLIIDPMPNRLWGTYFGGSANDVIMSSHVSSDSCFLITGKSSSSTQIATNGSYQINIGGNVDAFLSKFTNAGSLVWSTYYGGTGDDIGWSVLCDNSSNIFVSGETNSNSGITTSGAHQEVLSGSSDAFLARFNQFGDRVWSSYYGGPTYEYGCLASDGVHLYLAGRTESFSEIATSGAYQSSLSGLRDAFLVKFNVSGSRIWGTYLGGAEHEYLYSVTCDPEGNIVLTGGTGSTSGIATPGAFQLNKAGGLWDTFLMKFNQSGNLVWGTYYGVSSDDQGWSLVCDNSSNIYVSGFTQTSIGMSTTGSHQANYGGGSWDAYLAKFSSNGEREWGTYLGGTGDESGGYGESEISGTSLTCDSENNIVIVGSSTSTSSISTQDALQQNNSGKYDAFIAKFNENGTRLWGTYYGGSENDYGTSISYRYGQYLLTGRSSSTNGIATSGSHQDSYNGGQQDGFMVKFNRGQVSSISSSISPLQFCEEGKPSVSYTAIGTYNSLNTFTVQISNASGSFVNPTVIGTVNSTTSGTIQCQIPPNIPPGTGYRIRVVSSNPIIIGSDNGSNISISALPQPIITGAQSTCISQTPIVYSVQQVPGTTYLWNPVQKGVVIGSSTSNSINIRWTASGLDTLKIRQVNTQSGCSKDTILIVNINDLPLPVVSGPVSVCAGSSGVTYTTPSVNGHTYQWYALGKGIINGSSTGNEITVQWKQSGIDSIRVRQTNSSTGCFKDTLLYVTIQALPMPAISGSKVVCEGVEKQAYSVVAVPGHTYQWSLLKNGLIQGATTGNTLSIDWKTAGIDTLRIRQTNPMTNCFKDTILIVTIYPRPKASIFGSGTVCLSSTMEKYFVSKQNGYSYFWYPPTLGVYISGQTEDSVLVRWTTTGIDTLRVSIINTLTGCARDTFIIVSVVNSIKPLITSFGNQNVFCKGDSRGLECLTDAQFYQWKRNGKIIDGASDKIYLAFEAGVYTVHIKSGICEGESEILKLIEYDNPKPLILGEKNVVAGSDELEYRVSAQGVKSTLWSVSNNAIIKGSPLSDKINIQFPEPGKVKVSAKQESEFGCTGEDSIIIHVTSMTDVKEASFRSFGFFISPNPTGESDQFLVRFAETPHQDITIELLDILGSVHYSNTLQAGSETSTIPVQGLSSGMYMLRVRMNNEVLVEKVIVN